MPCGEHAHLAVGLDAPWSLSFGLLVLSACAELLGDDFRVGEADDVGAAGAAVVLTTRDTFENILVPEGATRCVPVWTFEKTVSRGP